MPESTAVAERKSGALTANTDQRLSALSLLPDPEVMKQVFDLAGSICKTDFAPKNYRGKLEDTAICILYGVQLGLPWNVALTNVAVVNGKPSLYGDSPLAICRQHPQWGDIDETHEGEGDQRVAVCIVTRKGQKKPTKRTFSVADAKRAKLWGKQGPWTDYPDRQMMFRARSWALRDAFGDALSGCVLGAEAEDMQLIEVEATVVPEPARTGATGATQETGAPASRGEQAETDRDEYRDETPENGDQSEQASPDTSTHPAIAAARELWIHLAEMVHGGDEAKRADAQATATKIISRVSMLHGAGTPKSVALDVLDKFGADVDQLAALGSEVEVEDLLESWEVAMREGDA